MANIALGSILIGSTRVDAVESWSRRVFSVEEDGTGAFPLGGVAADPARTIVDLDVDDGS